MKSRHKYITRQKSVTKLKNEVENGLCFLRLDHLNLVVRTAQVVSLRLMRADGRVCVKLGEWQDEVASVAIEWPGTKILPDETSEDSVQRLLNEQLSGFS